jgi:acyl-CoA reductase-like NAD-dependent aldehyde dehydrogenase
MAKTKTTPQTENGNGNGATVGKGASTSANISLGVKKTYKIYIGGAFPRTESGRYFELKDAKGGFIANVCQGSRKDFREAVVVARNAFKGWSGRAHFNRGQILYRIAEVLEGRSAQFVEELVLQGMTETAAKAEVRASIDRLVHYAGWADKYQQVFSSVNPVASSHFNFSLMEPTGVVSILAPQESGLLGLISVLAPVITGGNTATVLASEKFPLTAVTFAEVLHSSDVPGGVVNIITGFRKELLSQFASHMDVNATIFAGDFGDDLKTVQQQGVRNVKRVIHRKTQDWFSSDAQSGYWIIDTQETKTTWHPVGI